MFLDDLRLKRTGAIPGCVQINAPLTCLKGLTRLAVLAIGHHIVGNVALQLGFERRLRELL